MSGGLMQLVAYGAQDVYLTGNPQITFFKVVYRRHTNFAMEPIELAFQGSAGFGKKVTLQVTRNGDLITRMYLRVVLPQIVFQGKDCDRELAKFAWIRRVGNFLIDNIELEIGGSRIDKHWGDWMNIWAELTLPVGQRRGYSKMVGDVPELTSLEGVKKVSRVSRDGPVHEFDPSGIIKEPHVLFVPLLFFFNRNVGLALPLIALQYHEVRLNFEFRHFEELAIHTEAFGIRANRQQFFDDATLLIDYIYLDSEERRRFAQVGHEYLIEQLQFTGSEAVQSSGKKFQLFYNHPCKELIWAMRLGLYTSGNHFLVYTHDDAAWEGTAQREACELVLAGMLAMDKDGRVYTDIDEGNGCPFPAGLERSNYDKISASDVSGRCPNIKVFILRPSVRSIYMKPARGHDVPLGHKIDVHSSIISIVPCAHGRESRYRLSHVAIAECFLGIYDLSRPIEAYDSVTVDGLVNEWVCGHFVTVRQRHNYGLLIDGRLNPIQRGHLLLNGHDRFDSREGAYFNYVQPWQHHTDTPADGINVYSFALQPEEHQPSGTCNFSRIDTAQLNLHFNEHITPFLGSVYDDDSTRLYIYTQNYNILRVMSGMGGLAYSN